MFSGFIQLSQKSNASILFRRRLLSFHVLVCACLRNQLSFRGNVPYAISNIPGGIPKSFIIGYLALLKTVPWLRDRK